MRRFSGPAKIAAAALVAMACSATGDPASPGAAGSAAPVGDPPPGTPTWYRDVEPIMQTACVGCHTAKGAGAFPLDRATATGIASFIAETVHDGKMPPWPVGPLSPPIVDPRGIDARSVETIVTWAAAGAPLGDPNDHRERPPRARSVVPRAPDLVLGPEDARDYVEPASPFRTDEIRCFVMESPPALANARVTAVRFVAGTSIGVHDMGAVVVDATAAAALRAKTGADGRAGFECAGGLGDPRGVLLGGHDTGSGPASATILPAGTAVAIPSGGAIVLRVHYGVKHLAGASDRSTMEVWLARPEDASALRPLERITIEAPVEVPCPTGVSADPADHCSRESAFVRFASVLPADARARADAHLAACGTKLEAVTGSLAFVSGGADRFLVPTSCRQAAPFDGTIRIVRPQLLTRGASVRVEAERADGTWAIVLDIPRWRWSWAGAYVLESGVPVLAGRGLRLTCTFDNGRANQWSAQTGEPGHGGPAREPWIAPRYLIAAPHRSAEQCAVDLAIDRR